MHPLEGRLGMGVLQTTRLGGMEWQEVRIWNLLLQMQ
jgi:hypothetical protein